MPRELKGYQLIERSIIKTYRKELWNPFIQGVKNYNLVKNNDKIAVCVEGDAPSMLTAKLMSHLKRISDTEFELVFIAYANDIETLKKNAELLNIPVITVDNREALIEKAKVLGCNKIALSDTLDDIDKGVLYNMLYKGEIKADLPSEERDGVIYIRPLYCVDNRYINKWVRYNSLSLFEKNTESDEQKKIDELFAKLNRLNPDVKRNILTSLHSLSLDTMTGFIKDGEHHSFLEFYNE